MRKKLISYALGAIILPAIFGVSSLVAKTPNSDAIKIINECTAAFGGKVELHIYGTPVKKKGKVGVLDCDEKTISVGKNKTIYWKSKKMCKGGYSVEPVGTIDTRAINVKPGDEVTCVQRGLACACVFTQKASK